MIPEAVREVLELNLEYHESEARHIQDALDAAHKRYAETVGNLAPQLGEHKRKARTIRVFLDTGANDEAEQPF